MTARSARDLDQLAVAFRHQFRSYLRTYRFYIMVGLAAALSVGILAAQIAYGRVGSGTDSGAYIGGFLALGSGTIAILTGALLGGDAISMDFGSKTGYYLLVQPVRRVILLGGRFLAAALATVLVVAVFYVVAIAGALHFTGTLPPALAASFGLGVLYVAAIVALAFVFSALWNSPSGSVILAVVLLWLVLPILQLVSTLAGVEPWFLVSYAAGAVTAVLDPSFVHAPTGRGPDMTWTPYPWEGAVIMVVYLVGSLVVAGLLFRRKEMAA